MTSLDPSAERDATAKETATKRSAEWGAKSHDLELMVHAVKGELAANSSMTKMALNGLDALEERMNTIAESVEAISINTAGLVSLSENVEKSAKWMCKIARGADWVFAKVSGKPGKIALAAWAIYTVLTQRKLPEWFAAVFKAFT